MTAENKGMFNLEDIYSEDRAAAYLDKRVKDNLPKPVNVIDQFMTFLTRDDTKRRTKAEISELCHEFDIPDVSILPHAVKRLYGCMNCDWQHTMRCPFAYKRKGQAPHGGICNKRQVWLCFVSGDWKERPKLAEWQERFQKNKLAIEAEKDLSRKEQLQAQLDKIMSDPMSTKEDIQLANDRRAEAKKEWLEIMKILVPAESRQVEREMPKKIEIDDKRTIDLDQMHRIIRDARFEREKKNAIEVNND